MVRSRQISQQPRDFAFDSETRPEVRKKFIRRSEISRHEPSIPQFRLVSRLGLRDDAANYRQKNIAVSGGDEGPAEHIVQRVRRRERKCIK